MLSYDKVLVLFSQQTPSLRPLRQVATHENNNEHTETDSAGKIGENGPGNALPAPARVLENLDLKHFHNKVRSTNPGLFPKAFIDRENIVAAIEPAIFIAVRRFSRIQMPLALGHPRVYSRQDEPSVLAKFGAVWVSECSEGGVGSDG